MKAIVKLYKKLTENIPLVFGEYGVSCSMLDSSHVALIELTLPPHCFLKYEVQENCVLGINVEYIDKMLQGASADQPIEFSGSAEGDDFKLITRSKSSGRKVTSKIKRLNVDAETLEPPTLEYPLTAIIGIQDLEEILTMLDSSGIESVEIIGDEETNMMKMIGKGAMASVDYSFETTEDTGTSVVVEQNVSNTFSVELLKKCTMKGCSSNMLSICMAQDKPIMFQYVVADHGRVKIHVAPKVVDTPGVDYV